jgi:hypothetical protein
MTGNGRSTAYWTKGAYWTGGQPDAIALGVALTHAPDHEFEVLLDAATARRLVIVLTRLLMERDQDPSS